MRKFQREICAKFTNIKKAGSDNFNEALHAERGSESHLSWSPVYHVYQRSSYRRSSNWRSYTSVYHAFFGCPRFHLAFSRATSTWPLPSTVPLRLLVMLLEIVGGETSRWCAVVVLCNVGLLSLGPRASRMFFLPHSIGMWFFFQIVALSGFCFFFFHKLVQVAFTSLDWSSCFSLSC